MIARIWRGWTSIEDGEAYAEYVAETGIRGYQETPGNRGAWILRRIDGERTEFLTLSFWDSVDSIKEFAGDDAEVARFYPRDDEYLVDRELHVRHYELSATRQLE